MKLMSITFALTTIILLLSCKTTKENIQHHNDSNEAKIIINQAIKAHGGDRYSHAHYQFVFRDGLYTFKNNGDQYKYTSLHEKDGLKVIYTLDNDHLTKHVNGIDQNLSKLDQSKYSEGINSVIYFATLPNKLQDPAVNQNYKGTSMIKGKNYEVIEITFDQKGGGKDHDDIFYYWINKSTNLIDYLAYSYSVGKGGVRFRSAYNTRSVDGIVFQDYVNYKAEVGTSLIDLPKLYENEQLKELSVIATEDVVNMR